MIKSFINNNGLYIHLLPMLEEAVHIKGYTMFSDCTETEKKHLYCEILKSDMFDMSQLHDLLLADEFYEGLLSGYIKPQDSVADLMERLSNVFDDTLDCWIHLIYQYQVVNKDNTEIEYDSEKYWVAKDINNR